jgi:tRNA 2-thiouridine synthesizing protein A
MKHTLDITKEHCPMTFVKTRLKLDTLLPGEVLVVTLSAGEPLENVPKSAAQQGYTVLETVEREDGFFDIAIQK